jgi:Cysteine-rich secretory protein family
MPCSQLFRVSLSRWPIGAVATLLVVVAFGVLSAPAAHASVASAATDETAFLSNLNEARGAAGLRPYALAGDLVSVARQHSSAMATTQSLYHNPALTTDIANWQAVGENVGEGPTESDVHTAFMQSPEHRANILDHDFTQVGIGVTVDQSGIVWVTEDFRQPVASSPTKPHLSITHAVAVIQPAPAAATMPVSSHASPVSTRPRVTHRPVPASSVKVGSPVRSPDVATVAPRMQSVVPLALVATQDAGVWRYRLATFLAAALVLWLLTLARAGNRKRFSRDRARQPVDA